MTVPILAFFNNKGGVGKTSLVYHMAWMYADLGRTVVAVDLDPQANLTAAFLDEERIEALVGCGKAGFKIPLVWRVQHHADVGKFPRNYVMHVAERHKGVWCFHRSRCFTKFKNAVLSSRASRR